MSTNNVPQLTADFLADVAKKLTDARYQIFDGISKGAAKVSKTYTS